MDETLLEALRTVIDPELGLDVVSLGLVYAAERKGSTACVQLTMTSPTCPLGGVICEDAQQALQAVPGIEFVELDLTFDPPWTPERISDGARERLGLPPRPEAHSAPPSPAAGDTHR